LVVSRWDLVVGIWSLVVGIWSLVVGIWSLVVGWFIQLLITKKMSESGFAGFLDLQDF
jgi:hypothetical protein